MSLGLRFSDGVVRYIGADAPLMLRQRPEWGATLVRREVTTGPWLPTTDDETEAP